MTIFTPPWVQLRDPDTDAPLNAGTISFYLSGTTTPVNVYSDSALATSLGSVVTLNSVGQFNNNGGVYLDPANLYKIVVKNAAGTTVFTIDPYDPQGSGKVTLQDVSGASKSYSSSDASKVTRRTHSAAMSDTLPTAASAGSGAWFTIRNTTSAYNITVTVTSAGTIDGASSMTIYPGQERTIRSTGSVYYADPAPLYTGKRAIPLPAAAWKETNTNGCAAIARYETSTNKVNYDGLAFDGATAEYAYCVTSLPKSYVPGSLEFRAHWTQATGSAGDTVTWGMAARCYADDAALDQAYGTAATVTDTVLATGDEHITAWTAFTPAGDAADTLIALRAYRNAASDTGTVDAILMGIDIRYQLAQPNDA